MHYVVLFETEMIRKLDEKRKFENDKSAIVNKSVTYARRQRHEISFMRLLYYVFMSTCTYINMRVGYHILFISLFSIV